MRGGDERSGSLFSYVDLEGRVGKDHPLRTICSVVNEGLAALSGEFSRYIRGAAAPRFRQKSCCGRCCCRRSIRSARSSS
jgi:hypothetical protein